MGPGFLDRQSLLYMFSCNFICILFLIENIFFLAGYPAGYLKRADVRCNPNGHGKLDKNRAYIYCLRSMDYAVSF